MTLLPPGDDELAQRRARRPARPPGLGLGVLFTGPGEAERTEWAKAGLSAVGQWLRWLTDGGCPESGGVHVPGPLAGPLARYAVRGIEDTRRRNGALPVLPPGLTDVLRTLASSDNETSPGTMVPRAEWMTVADAASLCGVSATYLCRLARQGRIRSTRAGRKMHLLDRGAVEDFRRSRDRAG